MATRRLPGDSARRRWPATLAAALALGGCSVQNSELITRVGESTGPGGSGGALPAEPGVVVDPLDATLIAIIDERPPGSASLDGGTTGGGDYATAFDAGRIFLVDSVQGLQAHLGDDELAIVLIAEGDYDFDGTEERPTCEQPCDPATPLAQQTIVSGYCTEDDTVSTTVIDYYNLEVGANKTLIGLGAGARFRNVEVNLSKGPNVIVRNIEVRDVAPNVAEFGYGVRVWPGHHVWLDHLTLGNIGHGYIVVASDYDDTQIITDETAYVTITNCHFDGRVDGVCGQRSPYVVTAHRTPAVTMSMNWFDGSGRRSPNLFGPETWAHLFNNLWTSVDRGVEVGCGARGLLQGNAFETTPDAVNVNDSGAGSWSFCAAGYFGLLYAPTGTGGEEDNLLDSQSVLSLNGQPADGTGMSVPTRTTGNQFSVSVPVGSSGAESYAFELVESPGEVAAEVRASAGVGKLF